jgi:hypothetical protein
MKFLAVEQQQEKKDLKSVFYLKKSNVERFFSNL